MDRITAHSAEVLLARVNRELERISDAQHHLARKKLYLQEQATRLRLGASPLEVRLQLRAHALGEEERDRLSDEWSNDERRVDGENGYGGTIL
jgi:hypothetical protein